MTKQEFSIWTKDHFIYLDGATGSNLIRAGMPIGVCPESWILEHPDVLIELQRAYVKAGSNIVYTPTFSANRIKLEEYGLADQIGNMIRKLVTLSKKAVGDKALVAGDITMTGKQLKPIGNMDFEELVDIYKEQINFLVQAGVDLLVVETMMSLQETRAAVIAAKEFCELPVMVTMTFEESGKTLFGTDPVTAAVILEALGVDAVGVNCSAGPDRMVDIVRSMAEVTNIPLIAKPNAGIPRIDAQGNTCYDMTAEEFALEMQKLIGAGASVLGGCCGTDPEYIYALKQVTGTQRKPVAHKGSGKSGMRYLASERQTVSFGLDGSFLVIGERINPTGKKKFQASLKEGSMDMVVQYAQEQEESGAQILDVNMGMGGIDEKEMLLQALDAISMVSNLPLSIDSSHVEVIEAALRRYPGRALVNSISYEKEKFEKLLPIAKKYGAMFILLPLSDAGLPADIEEKKQIIEKIYRRALELGFTKEDIIVDGLVNTVGANNQAALQALETIAYCRQEGFATVCGLSNVSFGLPERSFINTAFLTLAIGKGLTMAIANPCQELLMGCAYASDLLLGKTDADMKYIEVAGQIKERRETQPAPAILKPVAGVTAARESAQAGSLEHPREGIRGQLYEAVLKGNKKKCVESAAQALEQGTTAETLLNEVLMPAIGRVGELFETGKYFLPQLIGSAEAMKAGIEVLEPHLSKDSNTEKMPAIVIATVEGDIHDIGKNLVALMLKNCGFEVVDLGKDVPAEKILEAACQYDAAIIALSALMTTTMIKMKQVIQMARERKIRAKIMVGGAATTRDYALEIGADGYAKDASEAVKEAKRLLKQTE